MSRIVFPPKLLAETQNLPFDFLSLLSVGESISTQSVEATVYSGTDTSPSDIVAGAATASGTVVTQSITGGVSGVIYELLCTITTSAGQTRQLGGYLAVTDFA